MSALVILAAAALSAGDISFKRDVVPFFEQRCASCHMAEDPHGGLALEADVAHDQLVRVGSSQSRLLRVQPGRPERSYLLLKMTGRHSAVGRGFSMPLGFSPATPREIQLIRQWIAHGAPNN